MRIPDPGRIHDDDEVDPRRVLNRQRSRLKLRRGTWPGDVLRYAWIIGDRLSQREGLLPRSGKLTGARFVDRRVRAHSREQHDYQELKPQILHPDARLG